MNSSRRFAAVLLTCSGLALAVSLIAQSNGNVGLPGVGTSSAGSIKDPIPSPSVQPNPPPHDPTVTAAPVEPKPGSGLTPGAADSGSGPGGRENVAPGALPSADTAKRPDSTPATNAPGAHWFSTLDTDRDGRISMTEFASPSASWLRNGAPGTGASNDGVTGNASSPGDTTGTAGPRAVGGPTPAPNASGPLAGPSSATNNAQLFQRIDTDHDGYLSSAEIEAYRAPTTLER